MLGKPLVPLSIVLMGLALAWSLAVASPRQGRFFSARHGVGVETPPGWTFSQHTGYPEILVVLVHPDGSRISLSAAPTTAADARALAEQSRRGLEAQHVTITRVAAGARGGVQVDALNPARASELRQLYLVRPVRAGKRQAVVLTLVARADDAFTAAVTAFDWIVAHLALELPAGVDEVADGGGLEAASAPGSARREDAR